MCVGSGGRLADMPDKPVNIVASKADYPEPDRESAVKTIVHPRTDGSFCCQNLIYGLSGQHFRITAERLAELRAKNDREWIDAGQTYGCDLPLGMTKEYDGRIHG